MHEMSVEVKVFQLGDIAKNLCKKVAELEVQMTPNTPPYLLEERRKETTEATNKIQEMEVLSAK